MRISAPSPVFPTIYFYLSFYFQNINTTRSIDEFFNFFDETEVFRESNMSSPIEIPYDKSTISNEKDDVSSLSNNSNNSLAYHSQSIRLNTRKKKLAHDCEFQPPAHVRFGLISTGSTSQNIEQPPSYSNVEDESQQAYQNFKHVSKIGYSKPCKRKLHSDNYLFPLVGNVENDEEKYSRIDFSTVNVRYHFQNEYLILLNELPFLSDNPRSNYLFQSILISILPFNHFLKFFIDLTQNVSIRSPCIWRIVIRFLINARDFYLFSSKINDHENLQDLFNRLSDAVFI